MFIPLSLPPHAVRTKKNSLSRRSNGSRTSINRCNRGGPINTDDDDEVNDDEDDGDGDGSGCDDDDDDDADTTVDPDLDSDDGGGEASAANSLRA